MIKSDIILNIIQDLHTHPIITFSQYIHIYELLRIKIKVMLKSPINTSGYILKV